MSFERAQIAKFSVVACTALAIGLGFVAQRELVVEHREASGLIIWAFALAFFFVGFWRIRAAAANAYASNRSRADQTAISPTNEAALLTAILGIGIFFRVYRIQTIPAGLNHDAAWNGIYAIHVTPFVDYVLHPYVAAAWGRETMFHQLIAIFQAVLGPTQLAIELPAVTVGIATLVIFYFLIRRLFDPLLALAATFLLGVSGWHVTLSKVGWRVILVPFFYCLTFFFLHRAVQQRRTRDFLIAGVCLGLSLDTYDAARIIPFIAVAYLVYEIVKSPELVRKNYAGLAIFGVSAAVTLSPLGWYALHHWAEFTRRGQFAFIGSKIQESGSLEPLFVNIRDALLAFNFRANGADFFTTQPLLDSPVSVLFPLGLAISLTKWRQSSHFLLLVMLALTMIVGIASKPNGQRMIAAAVPVSAFAALFVIESWRWLREAYPGYKNLYGIAVIAVLLYAGYASYDRYLGPDRKALWGFYPEATQVGRYVDSHAGQYRAHLAVGNWPRDTITYLSYQGHGDPFAPVYSYSLVPEELLQIAPATDKGTAFIITNTAAGQAVRDTLAARFPGAATGQITYPGRSSQLVAYVLLVPPGGGPGADLTSYTTPDIIDRDAERTSDLGRVAAALLNYRDRSGRFPDTGGEVDIACAYGGLGPLCQLEGLDLETFADPRGSALTYGYWYQSDGRSFVLYASFEGITPTQNSCAAGDVTLSDTPNLYCETEANSLS